MTRSALLIRRRRRNLVLRIATVAVRNRIKRAAGLRRITRRDANDEQTPLSVQPVEYTLVLIDDLVRTHRDTRNQRLDRVGDLSVLVMLPVSAIVVAFAYHFTESATAFIIPVPIMLVMTSVSVLCWYSVNVLPDYPRSVRKVVEGLGGIGNFPAQLWSREWFFTRSRLAYLDEMLSEFRTSAELTVEEIQIFEQLLTDSYEGSVNDLVDTARRLSRP
jgi:hypothetical protein